MIFDLTHRVEAASVQKATALRDKMAAVLEDDEGCTLIETSHARTMPTWRVVGVDVTSKQPFKEDIEAESEDAAKAKVEGQPSARGSRVVAEVRRA